MIRTMFSLRREEIARPRARCCDGDSEAKRETWIKGQSRGLVMGSKATLKGALKVEFVQYMLFRSVSE